MCVYVYVCMCNVRVCMCVCAYIITDVIDLCTLYVCMLYVLPGRAFEWMRAIGAGTVWLFARRCVFACVIVCSCVYKCTYSCTCVRTCLRSCVVRA